MSKSGQFLKFLFHSLRRPGRVGAIAPSSAQLVEVMISNIPRGYTGRVLEVGLGSGTLTDAILRRLPSETQYCGVELDPRIASSLQNRFSQARILLGSAADLSQLLQGQKYDRIVCSLPWGLFSSALQDQILRELVKSLTEKGELSSYLYLQTVWLPGGATFLRKVLGYFDSLSISPIIWSNLPPARVYRFQPKSVVKLKA